MCGICGFIKFNGEVSALDMTVVEKMNRQLYHRGPDAQECHSFNNVAFGFSRLSIIGVDNGMQPIYNEDRSVVVICNGEIFNYIELKAGLIGKGHRFSTETDVEVLVHLYEDKGIHFLNDLNGQFAFALYDLKKNTLYCARDQMGIIPFYYTFAGGAFVFGSEIKAIIQFPSVDREIDVVGLDQILTFAGLVSPRTMFRNISGLENGHYLEIDHNGKCNNVEYWDLVFPEKSHDLRRENEEYYADKLEELFEQAIKLRLRSDVPSGFYLSGGLDSSMIAMKIKQLLPNSHKDAFSIDFIESQYSESIYQKIVSRESGANLFQKTFFYDDISNRLQNSIYHSECPIKESYNTASLVLSEAVRARGIKVIQSGEGGDELFAGYVGYRFDKMRETNLLPDSSSFAERKLRDRLWGDPNFYYERNYLEFGQEKRKLYSAHLKESYSVVDCLQHSLLNRERVTNREILDRRAYIDYKLRLVDHLVSDHGDRMAMANSVEVRYPFLDKDLVEFSTTIPPDLKLKNMEEKYILKKIARKFVPEQVLRREKFHFIAPGSPYLLQKNVEFVNDLLSYGLISRQGYFNPDQIETLKKKYSQNGFAVNAPFENDLLIIVLTFGILLDTFFSTSYAAAR